MLNFSPCISGAGRVVFPQFRNETIRGHTNRRLHHFTDSNKWLRQRTLVFPAKTGQQAQLFSLFNVHCQWKSWQWIIAHFSATNHLMKSSQVQGHWPTSRPQWGNICWIVVDWLFFSVFVGLLSFQCLLQKAPLHQVEVHLCLEISKVMWLHFMCQWLRVLDVAMTTVCVKWFINESVSSWVSNCHCDAGERQHVHTVRQCFLPQSLSHPNSVFEPEIVSNKLLWVEPKQFKQWCPLSIDQV